MKPQKLFHAYLSLYKVVKRQNFCSLNDMYYTVMVYCIQIFLKFIFVFNFRQITEVSYKFSLQVSLLYTLLSSP